MDKDYTITRKEKTKNPGRVESGKRLAIHNKERRAREKLESEESERREAENESSSTGSGAVFVIGFLTVVVLGGALTFKKHSNSKTSSTSARRTKT